MLNDFYLDLANSKKKATHARDIVTLYYTKYKKIDTDDNVYYPEEILKELYNSLDEEKKQKVIDAIVTLTMDKIRVKSDRTVNGLLNSLKRWFDNNHINFEVSKDKDSNTVISSHHKWGEKFSDVTSSAIKQTLKLKRCIYTDETGPNYFRITITSM